MATTKAVDIPARQCTNATNDRARYGGEAATDRSRKLEPRPWPDPLLTTLTTRGDPDSTLIAKQRLLLLDTTHACFANPL